LSSRASRDFASRKKRSNIRGGVQAAIACPTVDKIVNNPVDVARKSCALRRCRKAAKISTAVVDHLSN
jgi:hypothetical protein